MSGRTRRKKRPPPNRQTQARRDSSSHETRARARTRAVRGRRRGLSGGAKLAIGIGVAVVALGGLYYLNRPDANKKYAFDVGSPGPGQQAPPIQLASTQGGTFDLSSMKGKTVLLYFQEGLTCQPCWDQLKDIDSHMDQFKALGIDQVVSITTDPIDQIAQKASDEGFTSPVLSDPDLAVSQQYSANQYGMMGNSRDGHTFIVVGPDGNIEWRGDYGGSPNYTMYVPIPSLFADLQAGLQGQTPQEQSG